MMQELLMMKKILPNKSALMKKRGEVYEFTLDGLSLIKIA